MCFRAWFILMLLKNKILKKKWTFQPEEGSALNVWGDEEVNSEGRMYYARLYSLAPRLCAESTIRWQSKAVRMQYATY